MCWKWRYTTRCGYGSVQINHKGVYAHRFSYELHVGPIREGGYVRHRCGEPLWVNPDHLYVPNRRRR